MGQCIGVWVPEFIKNVGCQCNSYMSQAIKQYCINI